MAYAYHFSWYQILGADYKTGFRLRRVWKRKIQVECNSPSDLAAVPEMRRRIRRAKGGVSTGMETQGNRSVTVGICAYC